MALLEAMAAGLPVVATRVGGNSLILSDHATGFLVPPQDSSALSKAIVTLLCDPISRSEMGKRGAARVRHLFSMRRMLEEHEQMYRKLLGESGKPKQRSSEKEKILT